MYFGKGNSVCMWNHWLTMHVDACSILYRRMWMIKKCLLMYKIVLRHPPLSVSTGTEPVLGPNHSSADHFVSKLHITCMYMMAYIIQFGPKTGLAAVNVTVAWLVDFNYQPEISLSEIWLEVELWTIPLLIKSNFRIKICYELSKNSNHRYRTYS